MRPSLHCRTMLVLLCAMLKLYTRKSTMRWGFQPQKKLLEENPNPEVLSQCILEALDIALNNNTCQYADGDGVTLYAKPNHGTAMGPCHACDYVDIFMGELDEQLVSYCPVPLLSSRVPPQSQEELLYLDWSRFRDDGFTILPDSESVAGFENVLQTLHPLISNGWWIMVEKLSILTWNSSLWMDLSKRMFSVKTTTATSPHIVVILLLSLRA